MSATTHHTTLVGLCASVVTSDLDRLTGFYSDLFGATVRVRLDEDEVAHAVIDLGRGAATIHAFDTGDNPHATASAEAFGRGHLDHVTVDVADETSFEALRARIVQLGVGDGTVVDYGAVRTVWCTDPDGMELGIGLWTDGTPRRRDERTEEPFTA